VCPLADCSDLFLAPTLSKISQEGSTNHIQKFDSLYKLCGHHHRYSHICGWSEALYDFESLSRDVCWSFQCDRATSDQIDCSIRAQWVLWHFSAVIHHFGYLYQLFPLLSALQSIRRPYWREFLEDYLCLPSHHTSRTNFRPPFHLSLWNSQVPSYEQSLRRSTSNRLLHLLRWICWSSHSRL
jgi:hypothetical protein